MPTRPVFVVTVDTEADNEWNRGQPATYENIRALSALQEICDKYEVRPTYLVTYDVANNQDSLRLLKELQAEGNCEIGAHLHAWRTPPFLEPLDRDNLVHAYLYEYPESVQSQKMHVLTDSLRQSFQTGITAHRSGRWGIDGHGVRLLEANGYRADTSVTPLRCWCSKKGDPNGDGGPNFLTAPFDPYYLSTDNITQPGTGSILEVPVSARILSPVFRCNWRRSFASTLNGSGFWSRLMGAGLRRLRIATLVTLNPLGNSVRDMIALCRSLSHSYTPVINMAFHSSELVAGCNPRLGSQEDQRKLWKRLEETFAFAQERLSVDPLTLTEYAQRFMAKNTRDSARDGRSN